MSELAHFDQYGALGIPVSIPPLSDLPVGPDTNGCRCLLLRTAMHLPAVGIFFCDALLRSRTLLSLMVASSLH